MEREVLVSDIRDMNQNVGKEVDNHLKDTINELGLSKPLPVVEEGSNYRVLNDEAQQVFNVIRTLGWEKVTVKVFDRPQGSDTPTTGTSVPPVVNP